MSSSCPPNWRQIACSTVLIILFYVLGIQPARGQSDGAVPPDVEQLQKKLEQMQAQVDQLKQVQAQMDQLKEQINTLKNQQRQAALDGKNQLSELSLSADPTVPKMGATTASVATATTHVPTTPNAAAPAQTASNTPPSERSVDVYGFAMLDFGKDFRTIDPNWYDSLRPTKLPSFPGEFGQNGNTYLSVRQTRIGVKGVEPTPWGDLKAVIEFDMYGTGKDAGITTMRPRHYYGELGPILAGQTNTTFMDIDVFPNNSLEYWGPNGMVFIRQPQFRWMPIRGDTHLWIAAEAPGQSADLGVIADRIQVQNIRARFPYPDLAGQYRQKTSFGYIQAAAVLRNVKLDHTLTGPLNFNQSIIGWGFNVSSQVKVRKDALHLQYVYGNGIENYMNDAPVDVAPILNPGNPTRPVKGKPLPMWSMVAYLDHSWGEKLASSLGYSQVQIQNTSLQAANAYHLGQYSTVSLAWTPFSRVMYGGELQWGRRTNISAGASESYRLQFSFKYSFDGRIVGTK
ncbi:MAG TPA: DcaP family trimeric outer membrane transporter [Terriglobales bacterium]